jgi:hypothetical protein
MHTNFYPKQKEESCLAMINNLRKQISQILNDCFHEAVTLEGGNEPAAKKIFNNMLSYVDVSTMLDVITDSEREESYEKIHSFFSGIEVTIFDFEPLKTHHFEKLNYTVLDLVFVYKVNIQERINENLKAYREYNRNADNLFSRELYLEACYGILQYCKHFSLLTEKELTNTRNILDAHKKNKFNQHEIIYIPKNMYSKID